MCIYLQNPTLEHYTNYNASELKTTVLELTDLQLNTKGCRLSAVREKYQHQKVRIFFFYCSFINLFSLVKLS